ncbi:MAG: cysteine hydrolase family protein [Clostridiaceae bacterium]|nr:cysteine hydrolase family protein [Clostridiaceae bacterium]
MKKGLLLIDIQEFYFKGGFSELYRAEEAASEAKKVLTYFRENNLPVFHIQHIGMEKEDGCYRPQTEGIRIYKDVCPNDDEYVITKQTPDGFVNTDLKKSLEQAGVAELVVCGMMTNICIDTTVRSAKALGYDVTVIEDACTTKDFQWKGKVIKATDIQNSFMTSLEMFFAKVQSAEEWIKEQ